jgi:PmbA protein
MNQKMLNLCAWVLARAKKAGADACRATVSRNRSVEIRYRDRKPETIKESTTQRVRLEVYVNHRYSGQSTSDLRQSSLADFIANAVAATRLLAADEYRSLPDPAYYEGRPKMDLKILDPVQSQLTSGQRHRVAREIEAACLEEGGAKTISVIAESTDGLSESTTATSNGFAGAMAATTFQAGAMMTAQDAGDRRPNGYYYATARLRSELPSPALVGKTAARRTLDLLGATKLKSETLPIIIENQSVPRALSALLDAMNARNIQQKQSFLADKMEQKIGSRLFTLIDDPLLPGGIGSRLFDSDGFPARRRVMIDAGVLRQFYVDWYYSRKLKWEPTTGDSSNLILPPGNRSVQEIMKDLGRGILVTDFIGGNSNTTTGDFSVGIVGCRFEAGVRTQPLAEMNIAGNHLKFWQQLAEVANDPWPFSAWRTPSLVFTDVVVSGV